MFRQSVGNGRAPVGGQGVWRGWLRIRQGPRLAGEEGDDQPSTIGDEAMTTTQKTIAWAFVALGAIHVSYVWWEFLSR
jgi:hypothetical protein